MSVICLFANDSSLAIITTLNRDLQIITEWSRQWLVHFNPNNTEVLVFSLNFDHVLFNNVRLDLIDNHKHLGVTFSSDSKWY